MDYIIVTLAFWYFMGSVVFGIMSGVHHTNGTSKKSNDNDGIWKW